uniref:hypothetical protein n=1 Tax=Fodinibius sp. TaxID=1872440 RepID=UPI00356811C2
MNTDTLPQDLLYLYERSLNQWIENLHTIPDDLLWTVPEGVTNSCGVLTQHVIGNLNHYIGHGIGDTGYIRDRSREFRTTETTKEELVQEIEDLKDTLEEIFGEIDGDELADEFPLELPYRETKRGTLIHLYGHLTYSSGANKLSAPHSGDIDEAGLNGTLSHKLFSITDEKVPAESYL